MQTPVTPCSIELGGETEAAGSGCAISGCLNHRETASGAGEGWRNGVPAGAGVAVIRDHGQCGQCVSLALSPAGLRLQGEAGGGGDSGTGEEGREEEGGVWGLSGVLGIPGREGR